MATMGAEIGAENIGTTLIVTDVITTAGAGETGTATGDGTGMAAIGKTSGPGTGVSTNGASRSTVSTNGVSTSGVNASAGMKTIIRSTTPAVTFTFSTGVRS